MLLNLKLFFSILFIGLTVDYLWTGLVMNNFYLVQYGDLARLKNNGKFDVVLWSAFMVYVLISLGVVFFALPKVEAADALITIFGWGFLFGVVLYGVYDFTNYATVAKWPVIMCVVDVLWGGVLCGFLTAVGRHLRDAVFMH